MWQPVTDSLTSPTSLSRSLTVASPVPRIQGKVLVTTKPSRCLGFQHQPSPSHCSTFGPLPDSQDLATSPGRRLYLRDEVDCLTSATCPVEAGHLASECRGHRCLYCTARRYLEVGMGG